MFRDGTDRQTHGHGDSMTNLAQWGQVGEKVIALSTLGQLGVIITILRLNSPILDYFHLLRHAYFNAI